MFILRIVAIWFVLMSVETLHGIARAVFLVPYFGDFVSRQICVFTGAFLILIVTYFTLNWMMQVKTVSSLLMAGILWVFLTVSFEIILGRYLGYSWERISSDYNVIQGGLLPFGLLIMAMSPLIVTKIKPEM